MQGPIPGEYLEQSMRKRFAEDGPARAAAFEPRVVEAEWRTLL